MSQLLFIVVCFYLSVLVRGNILVYRNMSNKFLQEFYDIPAQFGPPIPSNGLRVFSVKASEPLGCQALKRPPETFNKYAVIIQRGGENCSFEKKIRNAQAANYDAVIIYNYDHNDDLEPMSAQNATGINIPAVFVAYSTGIDLIGSYSDGNSVLVINDDLPFNINTQLILPFAMLFGLCFLSMIFYMIYKCVREERRLRRNRLPKNMLKKLKITKFTKGQPYEMCVICLDEFVEDDRLRVLPCGHAYHSNCIDPWLTKNKSVCPICKRKVFAKGVSRPTRRGFPSSDRRPPSSAPDISTDTDDDTTPLLHPSDVTGASNHGTFSNAGDGETGSGTTDADNQTSDDENVLLTNDSPSHGSSRVNPFDRQPNLPPNWDNRRSNTRDTPLFITILTNIFPRSYLHWHANRTSNEISIAAPAMVTRDATMPRSRSEPNATAMNVPDSVQQIGTLGGSQPTSNNILNPNLSGSFKDDDDIETHQTIYEPIAAQTPSAAASSSDLMNVIIMGSNNNNSQQPHSEEQDSIFIQTPSQGSIGVVALPNTNLRNPHHRNSSQLPPNRQYFI